MKCVLPASTCLSTTWNFDFILGPFRSSRSYNLRAKSVSERSEICFRIYREPKGSLLVDLSSSIFLPVTQSLFFISHRSHATASYWLVNEITSVRNTPREQLLLRSQAIMIKTTTSSNHRWFMQSIQPPEDTAEPRSWLRFKLSSRQLTLL